MAVFLFTHIHVFLLWMELFWNLAKLFGWRERENSSTVTEIYWEIFSIWIPHWYKGLYWRQFIAMVPNVILNLHLQLVYCSMQSQSWPSDFSNTPQYQSMTLICNTRLQYYITHHQGMPFTCNVTYNKP